MTTFIIISTLMLILALLFAGWPLVRNLGKPDQSHPKANLIAGLLVMLLIPFIATVLYSRLSTWNWDSAATAEMAAHQQNAGDITAMIAKLRTRLESEGGSPSDWVLLGRSYLQAGNQPEAMAAFDKAMALGGDKDPAVLVQLGQALVEVDESSLRGTAGNLFEQAVTLSPEDPASLWWSGFAAAANNRPAVAKARWTKLLSKNPPENIVKILNQQIAALDGMSGALASQTQSAPATQTAAAATPVTKAAPAAQPTTQKDIPQGTIALHVSLDPELNLSALKGPAKVFVIARQAGVRGPPIAVIPLTTADLPTTVMLSDKNAMISGTSITGVEELELIARISLSGRPIAAPGDLFGQINYRWTGGNSVNLVINTIVK